MRVITFGTYDLFHVGHLRILERAAAMASKLIVGVSSDELNFRKKGIYPVYSQEQRMDILSAMKMVDEVFLEESLEQKREYIIKYQAQKLVMGDDWLGRFDEFSDICEVVYLARTPDISTTSVKDVIARQGKNGSLIGG